MQKARRHPEFSGLRPLVSVRFQVLFTPLHGVLFTFPSQYWFTIGLSVVFSLAGWCRQLQTGFHRSRPTQDTDLEFNTACTGLSPPVVAFSNDIPIQLNSIPSVLQPHKTVALWFGLFRVRSPLLAESLIVFFSSGYLDVSVPRVFSPCGVLCLQHSGLPHSDIHGSIVVCTSPWLFAAYHVLRRLWEPRHSPYALNNFLLCRFAYLFTQIFRLAFSLNALVSLYFTHLSCQWTFVILASQSESCPYRNYSVIFDNFQLIWNSIPTTSVVGLVENIGVEPMTSRMQI